MNLIGKIKSYDKIRDEILAAFGVDTPMELINNTDLKYCHHDDVKSISFLIDEELYTYESVNLIGKNDSVELYYSQENGERFYSFFDIKNKLTEEEFEDIYE